MNRLHPSFWLIGLAAVFATPAAVTQHCQQSQVAQPVAQTAVQALPVVQQPTSNVTIRIN